MLFTAAALRDHVNEIFPIVPYVRAKMAGIVNKAYCVESLQPELAFDPRESNELGLEMIKLFLHYLSPADMNYVIITMISPMSLLSFDASLECLSYFNVVWLCLIFMVYYQSMQSSNTCSATL